MIAVSWSMVFFLTGSGIATAGAFFWLLEWMISKRLSAHLDEVQRQVNRMAGVTDAADAQYRAAVGKIEAVSKRVEVVEKRLVDHDTDLKHVKQRLGLARPATDV